MPVYRSVFNLLGMIASKVGITRDTLSLKAALKRCRDRGLEVGTVIDVGASDGRWSLVAREYFPHAFCLLIEAQEGHKLALGKLKSRIGHLDYVIAAAGDRQGTIFFDAGDMFGGLASETPVGDNCITIPMVTVDDEILRRNLSPPYLLKLDTHGFEVPILEGAKNTLTASSLVIIETYNFKLTADSLRFHEMCALMEERGFRCIDICEPMHRSLDDAFWQLDMFFIPTTSDEFKSNSYC